MIHKELMDEIELIKSARACSNITQKDIAISCATTIQTISKWEKMNYKNTRTSQLINIMTYLSTHVDSSHQDDFIKTKNKLIKICQNIKRIREVNFITQSEFAIKCGVTAQTIWRWEQSGYVLQTFGELIKIVEYIEMRNHDKNNISH